MTYPLENLEPSRFQKLCQSLLAKAFPGVQCFPVNMPDGGRDATIVVPKGTSGDLIVYQVKFSKNAMREKDPHKSIVNSLRAELPALKPMIMSNMKQYIVITNVPGTGHLESGSIDVVQKMLNENLSIPSQCWWRDDVERRLDDAWHIKWAFPEVLRNLDILRIIVEQRLSEDAVRRTDAIRVFLREQYDFDADVRFKQIELQNKLLDLFIDVPIKFDQYPQMVRRERRDVRLLSEIASHMTIDPSGNPVKLGAARLLLNPIAQDRLPWVVLEGAPGQGKSTIVQYICQVHRQRLLSSGAIDRRMEVEHRDVPLRLPFKVDCRDFSVWLSGKNPFLSEERDREATTQYRTLETFLAAQVEYHSGGAEFSVRDLQGIVRSCAILIVFDGLDEVADIRERKTVVEEISKGVRRVQELAVSLQCVVTSRPTAFTNSPGLSRSQFLYLQLGSIDRNLTSNYAEKWIRARGLKGGDATSVRSILREKLDQPHLRDLARNPMQLTILLSLIHTKGSSLPDKRTALYDNYISLFFDREAEKSEIVREQRELLIQIHRYLAWILHSEAQTKKTGGKVETSRLRNLVRQFLDNGGHSQELADVLFTGVVDRVLALVSRIEGSYEFEVQPMREYFVARYLYDTAPYSPAGDVKQGTLPDRFEALARDFFWQNVTRFYAGCYSQGELPSLLESLVSLSTAEPYKQSCYARSLANTLLSDYTFSQFPRIVDQVVSFVLSDASFRLLASVEYQSGRGDSWYLPKDNGRRRLVEKCYSEMAKLPEQDYAQILVDIIRANSDKEDRRKQWWSTSGKFTGVELTKWIAYGIRLGALENCSASDLDSLIIEPQERRKRLWLFAFGGVGSYIALDEQKIVSVIDEVLDRSNEWQFGRSEGILERFSGALSSQRYSIAYRESEPRPLSEIWEKHHVYFGLHEQSSEDFWNEELGILKKCRTFISLSDELAANFSGAVWATDLDPWSRLIEHGCQSFGDRWAFLVLANAAAAIRSKDARCMDADELFDDNIGVVYRARHARLRAGQWRWWDRQLGKVSNTRDLAFWLLLAFSWCGVTAVRNLVDAIDEKVADLDDVWWNRISKALENRFFIGHSARTLNIYDLLLDRKISERTVVAFAHRVNEKYRKRVFEMRLCGYDGDDLSILSYCQDVAIRSVLRNGSKEWERWLPTVATGYRRGAKSFVSDGPWIFGPGYYQMPVGVAKEIVTNCNAYPVTLVRLAEHCCRTEIGEKVMPVGKVASRDDWFVA